ncbi:MULTISPECIES: acyl-CoA dehydrogenase family protein [Pseudomonas]|nr:MULTISPECIES: acyl-CoA dehydrogenase family protein [Pseudomonas]MBS7845827.1 acyl-CoA dehydrogenase family protein [Pseudomonas fluorescens]MCK8685287.1 acyl-CoA dehydrogenase family protein [Pseudomonas umsongensis]MEB0193440.1 acyl-CoA dehydrogenase family protein [Pseudomonas sp. CCI1.1]OEC58506.1 acyl-CoA dehydrogenase [Pseudomonas sp. AP42]OPK06541.1 acyl-CoA dehydrogenase [Pseudomonas sp. VI4.1]
MNEQHVMIRDAVRRFAEQEIAPVSERLWEEQEFAYQVWKQAGELGFLGLPYPEEHGGGGGDWLGFTIVLEEIARVDAAVASSMMANSTPASLINNYGTPAQKERYLRPIIDGTQVGCIGLTEPNAGSDAANIQTRAVLRDGQWIINGSKTFITNSGTDITGPIVIAAVTGTRDDGRKEISNFILPSDTAGFSLGRKLQKIGWRGSTTYELFFEDCVLPADHLLGEQGAGLKQTLGNISTGRILIGALGLGILQGSMERSVAYLKDRSAFGKRLEHFQALQFKVADMATHAHAARLMLYDAASRKDAGLSCDVEASMAKLFATERAMEAAHQAIQIHGGNGIMTEYPVARAFGDAKVLEIVEGTSEIQRMIISRQVLS